MTQRQKDKLQRFIFENTDVRGEIVHLDESYISAVKNSNYPQPLKELVGQIMAATALLAATIKIKGKLTVQAQGEGAVSLVLVQCSSDHEIRSMAKWEGDISTEDIQKMLGKAYMAITIEPDGDKERYQGVVQLHGDKIEQAFEEYFSSSEQLATKVCLTADGDSAAGLFLQKLPESENVQDADAWDRMSQLASTITPEELLQLSAEDLIHRLFNQENVRLFEPNTIEFKCSCSREKLEGVLKSIGYDDLKKLIEEKGNVEVDCEYCREKYIFDTIDVECLFNYADTHKTPDTKQ
ncbi:MAG: Hsp33 family molecular chaperone HslO [Gammaproteobacteria bacterium]|nr:MAG: Hsp33 family molecular chaperone HslO [Gammaproteobacteria bacterium]